MDALLQGLKTYFGYDSFRPGQEALVRTVFQGGDALGVMPTGAGKSVCYQLPALLRPGTALVVSPLISLMQDQVRALLQMGVPAAYLNSSLSEGQMQKALANARAGRYKIIYVAPERLLTRGFLAFAQETALSLVAVVALTWLMARLTAGGEHLRDYVYKATGAQFTPRGVFVMVCAALAAAGQLVHLLLGGAGDRLAGSLAFVALEGAVFAAALVWWRLARTLNW